MMPLPDLNIFDMKLEQVVDLIEDLELTQTFERDNVIVHSGRSSKWGLVHVVLPMIGDPIVLPWSVSSLTSTTTDKIGASSIDRKISARFPMQD